MAEALTPQMLEEVVARLPRVDLGVRETPLEEAPRLAGALGVRRLQVKREDLTGLAFGGNKVRELEFIMGEAVHQGCDVLVAGGGFSQSNHARQCAAAARRAGLEPVLVLRRGPRHGAMGNLLVTQLLADDIRWLDARQEASGERFSTAVEERMALVAEEYRARGHRPYVLPSSFHPLAAAAYVQCAAELVRAWERQGAFPDSVYLTSSGATMVGLVLGLQLMGCRVPVVGVAYGLTQPDLTRRVNALSAQTAICLGLTPTLELGGLSLVGSTRAYGEVGADTVSAIRVAARSEGLLLDPVYTARAVAEIMRRVRDGRLQAVAHLNFVHTGGLPAIFAYPEVLATEPEAATWGAAKRRSREDGVPGGDGSGSQAS